MTVPRGVTHGKRPALGTPDGGLLWKQKAMTEHDSMAEKRIVDELEFGAKTARRVSWEAWEFTVVGPHLVEVTNASYGYLKDEHSYTVGVGVRDGLAVPAECECPADVHRDPDCKHKVALATVGNATVLNAAVNFENPASASSDSDSMTAADELRADGGNPNLREGEDGECGCALDFPCWACYRTGRRDLPE